MRLIRQFIAICCVLGVAAICAASDPPTLDKAQVIQIADDFARQQKWKVTQWWRDARFIEKTREWQVLLQTKQNGGPMIVYVQDGTKKVRFARGE